MFICGITIAYNNCSPSAIIAKLGQDLFHFSEGTTRTPWLYNVFNNNLLSRLFLRIQEGIEHNLIRGLDAFIGA
jgi:hypothetical protein